MNPIKKALVPQINEGGAPPVHAVPEGQVSGAVKSQMPTGALIGLKDLDASKTHANGFKSKPTASPSPEVEPEDPSREPVSPRARQGDGDEAAEVPADIRRPAGIAHHRTADASPATSAGSSEALPQGQPERASGDVVSRPAVWADKDAEGEQTLLVHLQPAAVPGNASAAAPAPTDAYAVDSIHSSSQGGASVDNSIEGLDVSDQQIERAGIEELRDEGPQRTDNQRVADRVEARQAGETEHAGQRANELDEDLGNDERRDSGTKLPVPASHFPSPVTSGNDRNNPFNRLDPQMRSEVSDMERLSEVGNESTLHAAFLQLRQSLMSSIAAIVKNAGAHIAEAVR